MAGEERMSATVETAAVSGATREPISRAAIERTPADYAIEHGSYLADAAEHFLNFLNTTSAFADMPKGYDFDGLTDHRQALRLAIHDFRKRANRAALSPAWLPISSAPKDGTEVLVSTANSRGVFEHMAVASWDDTDEYGRCEPRWTIFSGKHHSPALDYHPTHWLPLPPPPASCGEGV
jgi:hypothetical protein